MSAFASTCLRSLTKPRTLSRRSLDIRHLHSASTLKAWTPGPAPPRLPKEEQEIFEKLQKDSTGAFSTPTSQRVEEMTAAQSGEHKSDVAQTRAQQNTLEEMRATIRAKGDGEELHPNVRRGAAPEFDGDTNPETGEVGGPKNNPLRWGSGEQKGDWSYNGRVSDF